MGKLSFLKQKKFYINLLVIILLSFFMLWLAIKLLNVYTRHGKVHELPDFTGMTTVEVERSYGAALAGRRPLQMARDARKRHPGRIHHRPGAQRLGGL